MIRYGYIISFDRGVAQSITCLQCKRTSYNKNDIKHRYCGCCHLFHDLFAFDGEQGLRVMLGVVGDALRWPDELERD